MNSNLKLCTPAQVCFGPYKILVNTLKTSTLRFGDKYLSGKLKTLPAHTTKKPLSLTVSPKLDDLCKINLIDTHGHLKILKGYVALYYETITNISMRIQIIKSSR